MEWINIISNKDAKISKININNFDFPLVCCNFANNKTSNTKRISGRKKK